MRHYLRRARAPLAILLLCVPSAWADSIAQSGKDWVRFTLKPCEGKAAEAVIARGGDPLAYRAGTADIGGQAYTLCWQPAAGGAALVFDDNDSGFVPIAHIRPVPEV